MGLRLAIVAVLCGAAGAARADDAKAREAFERGRVAFTAGQYADAARAFEEAYGETNKPALLWNIAQAHRRQYEVSGDLPSLKRAREVYKNFAELAETEKERADAGREAQATSALLEQEEHKRAEEAKRREAKPTVVVQAAPEGPPFYKKAWFWVTVAAVVVVGAATGIVLALGSSNPPATMGGDWRPYGAVVRW
jgi:tetratricopeptide (TPR) repeat protein